MQIGSLMCAISEIAPEGSSTRSNSKHAPCWAWYRIVSKNASGQMSSLRVPVEMRFMPGISTSIDGAVGFDVALEVSSSC